MRAAYLHKLQTAKASRSFFKLDRYFAGPTCLTQIQRWADIIGAFTRCLFNDCISSMVLHACGMAGNISSVNCAFQ